MTCEKKALCFSVQGEFITNLAREWLFCEGKDFEKIIELLESCMCGSEMSEKQIRRYAEDVLIGRAELKGDSATGTFHLCTYDADEQPEVEDSMNIFLQLTKAKQEKRETQKELDKMREWYLVAMEHLTERQQREVMKETGQEIPDDYGLSDALQSFIDRMTDEKEHSTEDYGWLEPDGTFHEVEWAEHQNFAEEFIREHMTEEDWIAAGIHQPGQFMSDSLYTFGDYLIERGWVLLHNPSQGIAFPTKKPEKRYTKAQKEFLYDYYMERGREREANEIWEE